MMAGSTVVMQLGSLVNWIPNLPSLRRARVVVAASHFLGDVLPAWFSGRPSVVVVHHIVEAPWRRRGRFIPNAMHYLAEHVSLMIARRVCAAVLTSSQQVKAELVAFGFRQPIFVTVNAPSGVPAISPRSEGVHEKRVVFVGRLSRTKNIEMLLRAWSSIHAAFPLARLNVVGGGEAKYLSDLRALSKQLGVEQSVTYAGRASDSEKWEYLRSADVFAFPSVEEGFGIAVVEAMMLGIPCVTFDLPIFRELFPVGRLAAPIGDVAAFGRRLAALLEDRELRDRIGHAGLKLSELYTWDNAAAIDASAIDVACAQPA